jgi:hypothetical protein
MSRETSANAGTQPAGRAEVAAPDGQVPTRNPLYAPDIVALAAITDRHPNALGFELRRAALDTLLQLAYGEHAERPFLGDVPAWLASRAYDEIERRQGAVSRLLADVPALRLAMAKG